MGTHKEAIESGEIEEVYSDVVNGLYALKELFFFLNERPGFGPVRTNDGFYCLLDHQVERLDDIREVIRQKDIALDAYRKQAEAEESKAPAPTANAVKIREEFIAAKTMEGTDPGDIASAMNMKRTSIESVIRRLQGAGTIPQKMAVNG